MNAKSSSGHVSSQFMTEHPDRSAPAESVAEPAVQRFRKSLSLKFLLGSAAGLITASLIFLILFVAMYRSQLEQERATASNEINSLLQASLENAMLKRDIEGLRSIVERLGAQDGIDGVMILNPHREVRISSYHQMLGKTVRLSDQDPGHRYTEFMESSTGAEVLRSVNPVHNKEPCTECHGPVAQNPINGILVVDYDATAIRGEARSTTLLLMGSGAAIVLITLLGGWWFMRRYVLQPVHQLAEASNALSEGHLDTRVDIATGDELGQLGETFNAMAKNLQISMREAKEKENFVQALIDANPDGIRVIDEDFNIVRANRAYRAQLGMRKTGELHAKCYESSHQRDHPCPVTLVTCPVQELQQTGDFIRCTHHHVRRDGSKIPVEVYATAVDLEVAGAPKTLFVESIRDLTEAVKYSHEQKLSALGQLAAGVAHEIHNPLASVRLALQSTLRSLEAGNPDFSKFKEYLELVDKEVDECIDVTAKLLKLSVYSDDTIVLVDVNKAVEETVSLLNYDAGEADISIRLDLDPTNPRALATDSSIRLCTLNLVQNAFHAMPDGGELVITTTVSEPSVEISFCDNGVGIEAQDLQQLFDPFFSKRADGVSGTGLGLSLVKTTVERFQGNIEVDSNVGAGTCFTILIPSADEQ